MIMKKLFFLTTILVITSQLITAKAPIKFGKIDIAELEMTSYEHDTSAAAVVLCKYGYFSGNSYTYTEITRVKILKKSGVSLSEFTFPGKESMTVKGIVYNLENGEVIKEKLKRESIFKLKITDDVYRIRIALPNVKVGSVYEIQTTQTLLPVEFAFQREIPIKYCELVLEKSEYLDYRKRFKGFELISSDGNRFYVENMPAFKSEPFIDSKENYLSKFEFDILNVSIPEQLYYKSYTTSWESVNKRLRSYKDFGGVLTTGSLYLSDIKKDIEQKYSDPYDKLKAAYEAIKQVKWNGIESLYSSSTHLVGVFKDKKANSAEINMMLYQLLQKLDIYSLPVAISTRDEGRLDPVYPSLERLNYMFIWAKIDDKEYLLDATEEMLPLGMLPKRCLNQSGRLVNNESGKWIDLRTDKKDKVNIMYNLTITDELEAEGTMECSRFDYAAFNFRKKYKDYASEEEYLTDLEFENAGLRVKSFSLSDLDSIYKPIKEKYEIKVANFAQETGDLIMINPFVFSKENNNPFKLEERKYPIDFAYKKEKLIISNIVIPEGYTFNTIPKPARISLPEKAGSILINYSANGNSLNVIYKFILNKDRFSIEEYPYLKQLYALVIEKHSEPVIIKKL